MTSSSITLTITTIIKQTTAVANEGMAAICAVCEAARPTGGSS
jgi:hypothetical protein